MSADMERNAPEGSTSTTPGNPLATSRTDQIRARLEAATPGPWRAYTHHYGIGVEVGDPEDGIQLFVESYGLTYTPEPADAEFIAHAPADVAHLLAENERLRGEQDDAIRMVAVAHDTARREGYVSVADYDTREQQWRAYEAELIAQRVALKAEVERLREAIAGSPEKAKRIALLVASATRLVQIERDDARQQADNLRTELVASETDRLPRIKALTAERDRLAAQTQAVRELITTGDGHPHGDTYQIATHTLRAALGEG